MSDEQPTQMIKVKLQIVRSCMFVPLIERISCPR